MVAFGVLLLILSPVGIHRAEENGKCFFLYIIHFRRTPHKYLCFGGHRDLPVNSRELSLLVKFSENEVTRQWKERLINLVFYLRRDNINFIIVFNQKLRL